MNDLTVSNIERQNVLNNNYALQAIQENLDVNGLCFHDQLLFTTKMVAEFYGVDERTIKRYVQAYGDELRANGYFLSEGNSLKELKLHFVGDINIPKFTRQLGVFSFRAFLNIGMLLTESEKAKQLRTRILDIVIATINSRAGGGIRKVLDFVQNDLYYPTFVEKLTYLVFGLCTRHYFEDSNKRVALTIGVWFLVHNGYYWHAYNFMQCMEAIIYHVAAGRIDKDLLQRIITCYMANEDYPEDLKLEIIHAINSLGSF